MRRQTGLTPLMLIAWLLLASCAIGLAVANLPFSGDLRSLDSTDLLFVAGTSLFAGVFAVVGNVVAARAAHPIGWLLGGFAVVYELTIGIEQYTVRGLVTAPGSLPAVDFAAWVNSWNIIFFTVPLILILLLFPTGTVRSPRWRPLVIATPIAAVLSALPQALKPGPLEGSNVPRGVRLVNPVGVESLQPLIEIVGGLALAVSLGIGVAGIVCLVLRFRGAHGVERQQLKWPAFVTATAAVILTCSTLGSTAFPRYENPIGSIGFGVFITTLMLGLPLSIGAAILRYRLFDIDRIISRTLSYAVVTGSLIAAYVAFVVLFQAASRPLTGRSDLAIAASTLIVAALFVPLRRRVQKVVDHRFNRARYNAERTVEAFAARLREEVDLDALGDELTNVVGRTMQPSSVSLWLRDGS